MIDYKEIDNKTSNEVNIHLEENNGLVIDVSGYSHLAQTCWLTFAMKDLGKRLGKDYVKDIYDIELAVWDVRYKIEEIINKINNYGKEN